MTQFKRHIIRSLVILACALPWTVTEAQEKFKQAGVIGKIGYGSLTLHEKGSYKLAPGARFGTSGKNEDKVARRQLDDLRAGDFVVIEGRRLGDVRYVDLVVYYSLEEE